VQGIGEFLAEFKQFWGGGFAVGDEDGEFGLVEGEFEFVEFIAEVGGCGGFGIALIGKGLFPNQSAKGFGDFAFSGFSAASCGNMRK
jgi:hypothetical protein